MLLVRKRLAWIAAGWLLCHTIALGAPLAAAAIAAAEDLCTCPGGTPGAVCPMHHRAMSTSTDDVPSGPRVRNGCAQPDMTLLSLAGGLGVLPQTSALAGDRVHTPVAAFVTPTRSRPAVPEAPPPRA